MIRFEMGDLSEIVKRKLDALEDHERLRAGLRSVQRRHFAASQEMVHVSEPGGGLLRASGRATERYDAPARAIHLESSYGYEDPDAGPRTLGAVWAELERGGEHAAFWEALSGPAQKEEYKDEVRDHVRRAARS